MGMMYMTPMISPVKNPKINAKLLNDWQYEDIYRQIAIAMPASTQLTLEEVFLTILDAKGIVNA
jgi:hypothetical protein